MSIAIIGCGSSGSAIAMRLARERSFSEMKLIDVNAQKVNKLLTELHGINSDIEYITAFGDATKIKFIQKVLNGSDVLINAASPVCNIPLMKSCLNTNTNYIDLASDPFSYSDIAMGTTLEEQMKLNEKFIKKDLIAITNAGFSPGFTDIVCKHVVHNFSLDSIEYFKVYLAEIIESERLVISWSPYMMLLESLLKPTIYRDGKIVYLDSSTSKYVNFPPPIRKVKLRPFNGHPELKTIPEFIDIPVRYIEISGGIVLNGMQLNDIIVEALRKQVENSIIFKGDILEILSKSFENPDTFAKNYENNIIKRENASCIIEVKGKRGKKKVKYRMEIQHDIKDEIKKIHGSISAFLVSFVPSIIAKKIKFGEIKERGVVAPAALDNPSEIISECKKKGMNIREFYD